MINSSFDSYNLYDIFHPNENNNANNEFPVFNPHILENPNNYHESRTENQNSNLLSSVNNYNSINNDSKSENQTEISKDNSFKYGNESEENLINIKYSFQNEEKNKFILYLKNNNYIKNNNNFLEKDTLINKDKKTYEQNMLNVMNKLKCKGCCKLPNEFFICPLSNTIFCENCLGMESLNNKNNKLCISCNSLVSSKEHFIKLPIFNKIISYINKTKENNEKLFDNRIKELLDKNIILCGDDSHNDINKEDFLKININDIKNGEIMNFQLKAVYFCMECLKPFCSDCILNYKLKHKNNQNENDLEKDILNDNINKNDMNKKHNFTHPIFKINLLKEIGIFDLLYEKGKCEKIINDLSSFDKSIDDKIVNLDNNKQNMILIFDYIKNIYIGTVDEIITNLRNIAQEKKEKIEIIKEKSQELSNFLSAIKLQKDLKNLDNIKYIKQLLNDLNSFHKIPFEIKKKASKFINFKGAFDLKELTNFVLDLNLNKSLKKKIIINDNSNIKMKYDNKNIELKENNEYNNNIIIEEKKVVIVYNKKDEIFSNKSFKDCYSYPILINNNMKKGFLKLSETKKINIKKNIKKRREDEINNFNYEEDNDDSNFANPFRNLVYERKDLVKEINKTKYMIEINIRDLKKLNDDSYNIDFEIYNFNIF